MELNRLSKGMAAAAVVITLPLAYWLGMVASGDATVGGPATPPQRDGDTPPETVTIALDNYEEEPGDAEMLDRLREAVAGAQTEQDLRFAARRAAADFTVEETKRALAWVAAQPASRANELVRLELLLHWAAFDGRAAAAYAARLPEGPWRPRYLAEVLKVWALYEPQRAIAWVAGGQRGFAESFGEIQATLSAIANSAPELGLELAMRFEDEGARSMAVATVFKQLMAQDGMDNALKLLKRLPDGAAREAALVEVLSGYGQNPRTLGDLPHPDSLLPLARELEDENLRSTVISSIATSWGQANPREAMEWVTANVDEATAMAVQSNIFSIWGREDPQQAANWLNTLPEGPQRDRGIATLVDHWAAKDPVAAAEWLVNIPATPETEAAMSNLAVRVAEVDPAAAMQWADAIENEALRQRTLPAIIGRATAKAPSEDFENPDQLIGWADEIQNPDTRKLALGMIVARWGTENPEAAIDWIAASDLDPEARENMRKAFDHAYAIESYIDSDSDTRHRAIQNTARRWLRENPDAARNYIRTADIPASVRGMLLDMAETAQ